MPVTLLLSQQAEQKNGGLATGRRSLFPTRD